MWTKRTSNDRWKRQFNLRMSTFYKTPRVDKTVAAYPEKLLKISEIMQVVTMEKVGKA